jgi:hypothetical protein
MVRFFEIRSFTQNLAYEVFSSEATAATIAMMVQAAGEDWVEVTTWNKDFDSRERSSAQRSLRSGVWHAHNIH